MNPVFSKKAAFQQAVALLQELLSPIPDPSKFKSFMGFGALKELLLPLDNLSLWSAQDLRYEPSIRKIHELLEALFQQNFRQAKDALTGSLLTSYYTPDFVITPIVKAISEYIPDVKSILEPSAGTGRFVAALREHFPQASLTAIEIDHLAARMLKAAHPEADVIRAPFEEARYAKADLVISNIPFGNYNVYDDVIFRERNPVKIKSTSRIHNYFFIKGLDSLCDGGLLAFITSSGVMDSAGNKEIREYLVRNADLVTAIRLPDNTFASAFTYPTTDIILLRKCPLKKHLSADEKAFIQLQAIQAEDDAGAVHNLSVNQYYLQNRENALGVFMAGGQYEKNSLTLAPSESYSIEEVSLTIRSLISKALAQLEKILKDEAPKVKTTTPSDPELPDNYPHLEIIKPGNLATFQQKAGVVSALPNGKKTLRIDRSLKNIEQVQGLAALRNNLNLLLVAEMENEDTDTSALRDALNEHYSLFSFRFGPLNNAVNKKLCNLDVDGFKLLALERPEGQQFVKSDIFTRQITNRKTEKVRPESVHDAVLLSLNERNSVDIAYMAHLMQKDFDLVVAEAITEDLIYRDLSDTSASGYMTKDQFLSGKVVERLKHWERLRDEMQPTISGITLKEINKNIDLLKSIQPIYLKIDLIDVAIGERWVPLDVYESFAQTLFVSPVSISYLPSNDNYYVKVLESSNENLITYAASTAEGTIYGSRIMEYAMADYQPVLTKPDPLDGKKRIVDAEGMKTVEMKIREVKEAFQNFIKSRPDITETIEQIYNQKFNSKVNRHFDGTHLKLQGLQHFTPYKSQKDAVWMLLQNLGGIVDQKVGAGKTLIMILAAMEMKRLALSRKTLILCLKANVAAVVSDFQKAYPNAKLLAPDPEKDFTPTKRKAIFANIAMNDWDAVLLTHEQFLAIPQCPEITLNVLREELDNVSADLENAKQDGALSKRVLKGLIRRRLHLTARFKKTESEIKRDNNVWHFGNMGFDHMLVDESHEYKNLHFTTRYSNVAGLGSPEGSKRSFNMELAVRTLQKRNGGDKGVTFLSGTTISNSLVELYLLFKYLRPNALADLSISNFDSWARVYARKSSSYEFTVTNQVKLKERFREFVKVPELAQFYSEITHYVGPHNFKQDKPSLKNIVVNIDPTETQQEYIKRLIEFSKTKDPAWVGLDFTEEQLNAHMLIATTLAKKMSLDMRLIDRHKYRFEVGSKIDALCKNVFNEYMDSARYKGTQLIFCDLGTPSTKGFNVYAEVKRILADEYHIPEGEIQFIHDFSAKKKKAGFLKDIRAGKIRIALGGTRNLGTGNNVQDRVIAMHHLDIPWTPKDFEQRSGRGERPGNFAAKEYRDNTVNNYVYAVNQTLDAYQFNVLATKQKFIMQIKNNAIDVRKIDEGSFDQEGGMNFSEYVAILSGNTDLLEKVKLERKLADLERGYTVFLKRKAEAEFDISLNERYIQSIRKDISKWQADWAPVETADLEKLPLVYEGKPYLERKLIGELILARLNHLKTTARAVDNVPVLRMNNFTLLAHIREVSYSSPKTYDVAVSVRSDNGNYYNYADGTPNLNPALAGRYIIDCVKRIPKIVEDNEKKIEDLKARIATYERVINSEFEDKLQIKTLKGQIETLTLKIEKQYNAPEPEPQPVVEVPLEDI